MEEEKKKLIQVFWDFNDNFSSKINGKLKNENGIENQELEKILEKYVN